MKKIGTYVLIAIFLLIGLKSCIMTVISIKDYILIERTDEHGQQDRILLTPKYEMIYIKKYQDIVQVGIYKLQGQEATHYISGIYCIGTFPFGLRYYNKPEKVFDSQLTLIKKHGESFPNIGDSYNTTIVIYSDNVEIGKHKYKRLKISDKEKVEIENMINQLKSL